MKTLAAFVKKEFLQIFRDPSSILIAFVLPLLLSFIYMYGINMDAMNVRIGIKIDDRNVRLDSLMHSFSQSKYIKTVLYENNADMYEAIESSKLHGGVLIPADFTKDLVVGHQPQIMIIADGSEVNIAQQVQIYATGIIQQWLLTSGYSSKTAQLIEPKLRVWYNPDINSHHVIMPGSLAVTLSMVGLLLTALVIAREWERGTMEKILCSGLSKWQFIIGKYFTYYSMGLVSLIFNVILLRYLFAVPFYGSYIVLFFVGSLFLLTCMGIGLFISTVFKSQLVSCQIALVAGFLPGLLLSGLIFPINSMPAFFRYLTMLIPQRHFVSFVESEFLVGTVKEIVVMNTIYLGVLCMIFFALVYRKTCTRLE